MRTASKYRLMLGLTVACLLGLAVQSAYLLALHDRLTRAGLASNDPTQNIEARILANLDEPGPVSGNWDPFGWSGQSAADPFASLHQMQQRMDALFGSFGLGSALPPGYGQLRADLRTPDIEVHETPNAYQIVIAVAPETEIDLNTTLEDNTLSIQGTVKSTTQDQRNNYTASMLGQFSRTLPLPHPVDELGMATSQTKDGIVISVPKKTA